MEGAVFKPAIWHNSLANLQRAIGRAVSGENEENAGDALLGLLTFDDGLSLSLEIPHGIIIDRKYTELAGGVRAYAGEYEDVEAVFGFSQDGKWYVLRDVFVESYTKLIPGFSAQKIIGNSLTVSNKPLSDKPIVNMVTLELDDFTKWFRNLNITRKYEMKQDEEGSYSGCKKVVHEYEPPESCVVYQSDDLKVTVEQTGTEAGGPIINPEVSLSVASKLAIRYAKPIALDEAIQTTVHQLRELISLLSGAFCSIEAVQASSPDDELRIDYFAPFIKREHAITNDEVMHMPFPYPKIEERISSVIEGWFTLCPDAINAATILVSRLDGSVMPCDLTFIACASAFEALSRVGADKERFEQEKFESCMKDAMASIEDEEFQKWLEHVIHNRKSAGSLARSMVKKLQPFSSYLVPDAEKFLNDHRTCRNAYVHRDGLENEKVLKDEELHVHTKAVWFLCYVAVLDLIGITPKESLEALQESRYQDGIISQIRKQYAK